MGGKPQNISISPIEMDDRQRLSDGVKRLADITTSVLVDAVVAPIKTETVDFLSGLANRQNFSQVLSELSSQDDAEFSVMLIDVDHFKQINDRYGHSVGDEVIRQVSDRLRAVATKCSLVARLGGDEFGLIIPDPSSQEACETEMLAGELIESFKRPLCVDGLELIVGCSLGAARYPEHASNADELIGKADLALYHAKASGRNCWVDYFDQLGLTAARISRLVSDLPQAIANQDIFPQFQAIRDLKKNRIVGFEVLARWNHPELGLIKPAEFIANAGRFGLSNMLMQSIIRQAVLLTKDWPDHVYLSFNISPTDLCADGFCNGLLAMLKALDFPAHRFQIEVTEEALLQNLKAAGCAVAALRSAGIRVVLDDFGSGYSGLSYLRELVLDGIKIDRSFIGDITPGCRGWRILSGIISLADSLALDVIIEGIETGEARKHAFDVKAGFGQGYYFGAPVAAQDVDFPDT
jgi:diguanylate cyclase (GGDEF)-like protein